MSVDRPLAKENAVNSMPVRIVTLAIAAAGCLIACSSSYAQSCTSCPGDMNGDGLVLGDDVQLFVTCLSTAQSSVGACACADLDGNGAIDVDDVSVFTSALIRSTIFVPSISIGRDLQERIVLTIAPPPPTNITVNVTSGSPSQLLLSDDPFSIG